MSEDFLQFIWKYGLFDPFQLFTDDGEPVEVISMGTQNHDAGPDFLNARVRIGDTVWAGNVEVHLRSSDWYRHRHHMNKLFDNVILQVVYRHDRKVRRSPHEPLPVLELKFDEILYANYRNLLSGHAGGSCRQLAAKLDRPDFNRWLGSLAEERILQKADHLSLLLKQNKNKWEDTFYISLARGFGFGLNGTPFELTARSLPLKYLSRHRGNIMQMEALLFGQAGLLGENTAEDFYTRSLTREYNFLRKKYNLAAIEPHLWKSLRLRPSGFPAIRISQFAAVINRNPHLFSGLLEACTVNELCGLFSVSASTYWNSHYSFGNQSRPSTKTLGRKSIHSLLINAVIPCVYVYGCLHDRNDLKDRAAGWLNDLPAESNHVTRQWILPLQGYTSASQSQGLLQLSRNYCRRKRCLSCLLGIKMFTGG